MVLRIGEIGNSFFFVVGELNGTCVYILMLVRKAESAVAKPTIPSRMRSAPMMVAGFIAVAQTFPRQNECIGWN